MIRARSGFSLLEVMLASLVLMIGVVAVARLSQGLLSSFDPSQEHGLAQHPAIVESLLRDQAEQARSVTQQAAVSAVPPLVTPHGTYSVTVHAAAGLQPDSGDSDTLPDYSVPFHSPGTESPTSIKRTRYVAAVYYQAIGKTNSELAGLVVFDKVTGMTGRSGL